MGYKRSTFEEFYAKQKSPLLSDFVLKKGHFEEFYDNPEKMSIFEEFYTKPEKVHFFSDLTLKKGPLFQILRTELCILNIYHTWTNLNRCNDPLPPPPIKTP